MTMEELVHRITSQVLLQDASPQASQSLVLEEISRMLKNLSINLYR